jgi:hypothetical protein
MCEGVWECYLVRDELEGAARHGRDLDVRKRERRGQRRIAGVKLAGCKFGREQAKVRGVCSMASARLARGKRCIAACAQLELENKKQAFRVCGAGMGACSVCVLGMIRVKRQRIAMVG